jgi:hypothetical protein
MRYSQRNYARCTNKLIFRIGFSISSHFFAAFLDLYPDSIVEFFLFICPSVFNDDYIGKDVPNATRELMNLIKEDFS